MAKNKSWKGQLLSSGLPLESSAAGTLSRLGFLDLGEQSFELDGEFHSADIRATKFHSLIEGGTLHSELSLFVECKYLRPGKEVVFVSFGDPRTRSHRSFSKNAVMAAGIEMLPGFGRGSYGRVIREGMKLENEWIPGEIRVCHKGVIIPLDQPDILRKAQLQLSVPLVKAYAGEIEGALVRRKRSQIVTDGLTGEELDPYLALKVSLHVPIIVTNAPIFALREGLNIADIEAAKNLLEVADEIPYLLFVTRTLGHVEKLINAETSDLLEGIDPSDLPPSFHLATLALGFFPRRFYVVRIDSLERFVASLDEAWRTRCEAFVHSLESSS